MAESARNRIQISVPSRSHRIKSNHKRTEEDLMGPQVENERDAYFFLAAVFFLVAFFFLGAVFFLVA